MDTWLSMLAFFTTMLTLLFRKFWYFFNKYILMEVFTFNFMERFKLLQLCSLPVEKFIKVYQFLSLCWPQPPLGSNSLKYWPCYPLHSFFRHQQNFGASIYSFVYYLYLHTFTFHSLIIIRTLCLKISAMTSAK